jgi:protein-S-isoprenylcysteine O-methyltransferase Ste14
VSDTAGSVAPNGSPRPDAGPGATAPILVRCGTFFFRYRDALSPAVFLGLIVVTRRATPLGGEAFDRIASLLGMLLGLAGLALRVAVVGYAYIVRAGKEGKVYAEDLVTGGLFATSRNPLYVGNVLLYAGLIAIWNRALVYVVGLAFYLFMYRAIVAAEEAFLRRKFGTAYDEYTSDVPRWLPDLRRLRGGISGMAFNWRRVVLKEYGTIAAWLLAACFLLGLKQLSAWPTSAPALGLGLLGGAMALVVILWGAVRWLKLSRRWRA